MSSNRRKILADVICPDCGAVRQRERRDLNRYSHYCRSCIQRIKKPSTYVTGRKAHNNETHVIHIENPFDADNLTILPKTKMRRIHKAAIHRGIEWKLTASYLEELYKKQTGLCALSGLPMSLDYGKHSISIDRIDSAQGYLEGNVQFVIKEVNFMKQDLQLETFKHYCKLIGEKQ